MQGRRWAPFAARLLQRQSGQYLLFCVAGRTVFGYDIVNRQRMDDTLLEDVEPVRPEFSELGFEGDLPGELNKSSDIR